MYYYDYYCQIILLPILYHTTLISVIIYLPFNTIIRGEEHCYRREHAVTAYEEQLLLLIMMCYAGIMVLLPQIIAAQNTNLHLPYLLKSKTS